MTNMTRIVDGKRVITLDELQLQCSQIEGLERDMAEMVEEVAELRKVGGWIRADLEHFVQSDPVKPQSLTEWRRLTEDPS